MTTSTINTERYISGSVGATAVVVDCYKLQPPITITVIPGSGNTSSVEASTTLDAVANPAGAVWIAWPAGTVSGASRDVFTGHLTALRFTRVTGSSTDGFEVA